MGEEYPKRRRRMSGGGFAAIPNAVLRDKTLPPSAKLVYGVIQSYAWGGRRCTASSKTLADDAGIGRSAFFEALAVLRERDLIDVQKVKGPNGWRNVYAPLSKGLTISDEAEFEGSSTSRTTPGVVRDTDGGSSATRTEKKTKREEDEETAPPPARARGLIRVVENVTYRGRTVPESIVREAIDAVEHWANATSQTVRAFDRSGKQTESLKRVVGAMLTYAEVVEHWRGMIDRSLAAPWWKDEGPPGIGVVFGPKVVERSLALAQAPAPPARRTGRTSTVDDYLSLLPMADAIDAADAAAGRVVA